MSLDYIPADSRRLRACLGCSIIKSFEQFSRNGCDNCEIFLRLADDVDNVQMYTSNNFSGMVDVMEPPASWMCKSLRISTCVPGIYAISVSGTLPREIIRKMGRMGIVSAIRERGT